MQKGQTEAVMNLYASSIPQARGRDIDGYCIRNGGDRSYLELISITQKALQGGIEWVAILQKLFSYAEDRKGMVAACFTICRNDDSVVRSVLFCGKCFMVSLGVHRLLED